MSRARDMLFDPLTISNNIENTEEKLLKQVHFIPIVERKPIDRKRAWKPFVKPHLGLISIETSHLDEIVIKTNNNIERDIVRIIYRDLLNNNLTLPNSLRIPENSHQTIQKRIAITYITIHGQLNLP
jgi:hypothetical protein